MGIMVCGIRGSAPAFASTIAPMAWQRPKRHARLTQVMFLGLALMLKMTTPVAAHHGDTGEYDATRIIGLTVGQPLNERP